MAGHLYRSSSSVAAHLAHLRALYGFWEYRSGYVMAADPRHIAALFDHIRSTDGKSAYLECIGGACYTTRCIARDLELHHVSRVQVCE